MDLLDTIQMMKSDDYKERFKAEYYQLKIRLEKLNAMIIRKAVNPEVAPGTSYLMLKQQAIIMEAYLKCLEDRAMSDRKSVV